MSFNTRNHKPFGDELTTEFTLAEQRLPNATQMELVRDHALSLAGAKVAAFGVRSSQSDAGGNAGNAQTGGQLLQDLHKLANRKK